MIDRPDLGKLVDHLGEPRQMLADGQARLSGRDRLKLAANAGRSARLHVKRIQMRRSAELMQEDDVLGPRPRTRASARPSSKEGRLKPAMPAVPASSSRRRENRQVVRKSRQTGNHVVRLPELSAAARTLCCSRAPRPRLPRPCAFWPAPEMPGHGRSLALRRQPSQRGQIDFIQDLGIRPARIQALADSVGSHFQLSCALFRR